MKRGSGATAGCGRGWSGPKTGSACPYFGNNHLYAQIIDDLAGRTIAAASTLDPAIKPRVKGNTIEAAKLVGTALAERAKAANVTAVVFDRGGYLYHGKLKALADAAREAGLRF